MAGGRPGDSGSIPAARGTATQGSGAVGWPWGLGATFGGPEPRDGAVGAGLRPSALRGGHRRWPRVVARDGTKRATRQWHQPGRARVPPGVLGG